MLLPKRISERELKRRHEKKLENIEKRQYSNFCHGFDLNAALAIVNKNLSRKATGELIEKKSTTINPFMWQKELLGEYCFFGSVLGYIDSGLDQITTRMNFEKSFLDKNGTSEEYESLQDQYIELETRRENIVKDYQEVIPSNSLEVINESVSKYPGYANFGDVYASNISDELQYPLQTEYIKAYTEGYMMNRKGLREETIYSAYETNINKIKEENAKKVKVIKG